MGGERPLGIVRLTTMLPADEFVRRHATFCQTLWMHRVGRWIAVISIAWRRPRRGRCNGAPGNSPTSVNFGGLSAADEPLTTLLPHIAEGIAAKFRVRPRGDRRDPRGRKRA